MFNTFVIVFTENSEISETLEILRETSEISPFISRRDRGLSYHYPYTPASATHTQKCKKKSVQKYYLCRHP